MPVDRPYIYWDGCIFIDYFQKEPSRIATLDALVLEARDGKILLVTSTLSIAEAAFGEHERPPGRLNTAKLEELDAAWHDRSVILLWEFHAGIAEEARRIIREGVHNDRGLRSADAIHLATAKDAGVESFHTYDEKLLKWDGIYFPIKEPASERPMLPHFSDT
jgi:predicted nucleic acid-binding protein